MFGFLEGMVTLLTSADSISPANRQLPSGDLISLYYVLWIIVGFVTTDFERCNTVSLRPVWDRGYFRN